MTDPVMHMCPACGNPPIAGCGVCLGTGLVTGEGLDRYNAVWNTAMRSGGVINPVARYAPKRTVPAPPGLNPPAVEPVVTHEP